MAIARDGTGATLVTIFNVTSGTVTFTTNANRHLVLTTSLTQNISSISDSGSGSWTRKEKIAAAGGGAGLHSASVNYSENRASITSVTVNLLAAGYGHLKLDQYSGVATSGSFDVQVPAEGAVSSATWASGNLTASDPNCLIVGVANHDDSANAVWGTPGGSWNEDYQYGDTSINTAGQGVSQIASGSTGPFSLTWNYPAGTSGNTGISMLVSFLPGSTAPTLLQQPAPTNVVVGQPASFSVVSSDTSSTYQWQDDSSGSFADIGGATIATYTTAATTSSFEHRQYKCVVTNAGGSVTSAAAALELSWHDVYLYQMPEDTDPDDVRLRDPTVVVSGGLTAVASDTNTPTDSAVADAIHTAVASDTNTPTDSALADAIHTAVAADTNTPTDSAVGSLSFVATATDTNTPTDSALADVNKLAVAADTNTPTDSALADASKVAVATDTNTPSDSALADVSKVAVASDTNTPSDSAVASISTGARTAVASDTNTPSDSALADVSKVAVATDTNTPTDSALADVSKVAVASDTNAPSDSALADVNKVAVASDTNSPTDSAVASISTGPISHPVVAADTIALSDSAIASVQHAFSVPVVTGADDVYSRRDPRELRKDLIDAIQKLAPTQVTAAKAIKAVKTTPITAVAADLDLEAVSTDVKLLVRKALAVVQSRQQAEEEDEEILLLL